jgi:hypothetical protein
MKMDQQHRPSEDLWRRTLAQIPSVFGRLDYLARLRDPNTGAYQHHGLAQVFGAEEADRALRDSHLVSFQQWLEMNLKHQKADLALFFSGLLVERNTLIETWLRLAHYQNLIPAAAGEPERILFMEDIEALLKALRSGAGGGE